MDEGDLLDRASACADTIVGRMVAGHPS